MSYPSTDEVGHLARESLEQGLPVSANFGEKLITWNVEKRIVIRLHDMCIFM